jgi:hypothetical protein
MSLVLTIVSILKRRGSVIFDAELVFVPGSEDEITRVLDDISATGVLGDFSLVPGSLTTRDIPGNAHSE